jgi:hypothetical protein
MSDIINKPGTIFHGKSYVDHVPDEFKTADMRVIASQQIPHLQQRTPSNIGKLANINPKLTEEIRVRVENTIRHIVFTSYGYEYKNDMANWWLNVEKTPMLKLWSRTNVTNYDVMVRINSIETDISKSDIYTWCSFIQIILKRFACDNVGIFQI